MAESTTGGNTIGKLLMGAATFAVGLIVFKVVSKAVGMNSNLGLGLNSSIAEVETFVEVETEPTAGFTGTPTGGTCQDTPANCAKVCSDNYNGTMGDDNRCYVNGVPITGHPFTGGQRSRKRSARSFWF